MPEIIDRTNFATALPGSATNRGLRGLWPSRKLVAGLKRLDVPLANPSGFRIQRPHGLRSVSPVAGPMRHARFRAAKTMGGIVEGKG
jgi:hypothetical protein